MQQTEKLEDNELGCFWAKVETIFTYDDMKNKNFHWEKKEGALEHKKDTSPILLQGMRT